jgi:uncharacterized protein (DUF3820 family)
LSESKPHELEQLANMRMPFGKYKGKFLIHIPEPYLIWYRSKGFPPGKLGRQLELILEIKINGLESLIYPLMRK